MLPFVESLSKITIRPFLFSDVQVGGLVFHRFKGYAQISRVIKLISKQSLLVKGDNQFEFNEVRAADILGVVYQSENRDLTTQFQKKLSRWMVWISYYPSAVSKWMIAKLPLGKNMAICLAVNLNPLMLYNRLFYRPLVFCKDLRSRLFSKQIEIRNFAYEDTPDLVCLWNLCFPAEEMDIDHFLKKICASPWFSTKGCFVASKNKRIVGFILASARRQIFPRTGFIECIAVNPDERRQGVGALLLEQAVQYLKKDGCRKFQTSYFPVACDEQGWAVPASAMNFFGRFGFEIAEFGREFTTRTWNPSAAESLTKRLEHNGFIFRFAVPEDHFFLEQMFRKSGPRWGNPQNAAVKQKFNTCLVAVKEGRVVGYCRTFIQNQTSSYDQFDLIWDAGIDRGKASIGFLYVEPEYRTFGLGAALTAEAIKRLLALGYPNLWGHTSSLALQGRYRKWGLYSSRGVVMMSCAGV